MKHVSKGGGVIAQLENVKSVFFDIDDTIAHNSLGYSDVGYFEYVLAALLSKSRAISFSRALDATLVAESGYAFWDPFAAAAELEIPLHLFRSELLEFQKKYVLFFEDALFLIKTLKDKGYNLYITSNNSRSRAYAILAAAELSEWESSGYFSSIFCPENTGFNKRNPEFYRKVIEAGGFSPEEMLIVGDDTTADYDMPGEAGIRNRVIIDRTKRLEDAGGRLVVSDLRNILNI